MTADVKGFTLAVYEATFINPFAPHEWVWPREQPVAAFELKVPWNGEGCLLGAVRTFQRGRGDGTRALQWLCGVADGYGVRLYASVQPFGPRPRLGVMQLRAWYRRHGFALIARNSLVYLPQKEKAGHVS